MSKMRIYEYAKNNQMTSKQVIEKLKSLNINVSNHMSTIDQQTIERLNKEFGKDKKESQEQREHKPVQKKANEKERAANHRKEPLKQKKKQHQPPQQQQKKP